MSVTWTKIRSDLAVAVRRRVIGEAPSLTLEHLGRLDGIIHGACLSRAGTGCTGGGDNAAA